MSKFIGANNFQAASEDNNLEQVKIIADRLGRENLDPTSLLFALAGSKTFEESVECTKSLLDAGVDIKALNSIGATPIGLNRNSFKE